jgi:hypothetical protein
MQPINRILTSFFSHISHTIYIEGLESPKAIRWSFDLFWFFRLKAIKRRIGSEQPSRSRIFTWFFAYTPHTIYISGLESIESIRRTLIFSFVGHPWSWACNCQRYRIGHLIRPTCMDSKASTTPTKGMRWFKPNKPLPYRFVGKPSRNNEQ